MSILEPHGHSKASHRFEASMEPKACVSRSHTRSNEPIRYARSRLCLPPERHGNIYNAQLQGKHNLQTQRSMGVTVLQKVVSNPEYDACAGLVREGEPCTVNSWTKQIRLVVPWTQCMIRALQQVKVMHGDGSVTNTERRYEWLPVRGEHGQTALAGACMFAVC